MGKEANIEKVYRRSEDVVAREIQGEFLLIPITSGIGDLEEEIFSLNETGRAIWEKLDGKISLGKIAEELSLEHEATPEVIQADILGLSEELLKRKMLVEAN